MRSQSHTVVEHLTRSVPYDGYIRHQNDHLSGRMTDISVMGEWEVVGVGGTRPLRNVLGEALKGRFSFEARNYIFSFPSYVHFEEFFCFPRFCKIWRQTFEPLGFWFRRCLGALFENCARSLGIFLRTPTTTTSIFWKFLFFFQSRAVVTCLTAMVIPRLSKALWWWFVEKLEWKLDFRALARSSAEGPPIVVAFSTSHLRWSMVQKRQKPDEVSLWLPFIVCKTSEETSELWGACFRDPMFLPFCYSLFSCVWLYNSTLVRMQIGDSEEEQSPVTLPMLITEP